METKTIDFTSALTNSSETAIVRGALIRGLTVTSPKLATVRVGARKARKYYGTLAYNVYNPRKHDESRK